MKHLETKELTYKGVPHIAIPKTDYEDLLDLINDLQDARAVKAARRNIAAGSEETLPFDVVMLLAEAKTPGARLKVWREWRGLGKAELGRKVSCTGQFLSQIEGGNRKGDAELFRKLADALVIRVDDLL